MNEGLINENARLEEAISIIRAEPNRENLASLMENICVGINANARLVIPVVEPQEVVDNATEETKLSMRVVRLTGGKRALVAFTSISELNKGESTASMMQTFKAYFDAVNEMRDIDGVILNPWGTSYFLSKEGIETILSFNKDFDPERRIYFDRGDITEIDCDCIVNAANSKLLGGGGVDGAIHRAAGPGLLEECRTLGGCETGEAKITKGHNLKAKYVIHTVGPVYSGRPEDKPLLESCYLRSLELAKENGVRSIAFPAISTGAYRYPPEEAARIALNAVHVWLEENKDCGITVIFSCFDQKTYDIYTAGYEALASVGETAPEPEG